MKKYYIMGRLHVPHTGGVRVVKNAPFDDLLPERGRQRGCANQARHHGGDAVLVTGNAKIHNAFRLTREDLEQTAALIEHKDKLVLVIQFESEVARAK